MRVYKDIQFADGLNMPFADFKKTFATHLIGLSESEVKECYKKVTVKPAKDVELSNTPTKSKKTQSEKGK